MNNLMDSLHINIRFYYWHLKLRKGSFLPYIEANEFWQEYYNFKGAKPVEPLFEVYNFFT